MMNKKIMKLWLLRGIFIIILMIGMIRLIQFMVIIDKMNESLFVNNINNNLAITTNSIVLSSSTQQQQPRQESTSLMNNAIPKNISSCYKTRLRMVYPLYGINGCINENDLAENNLLGSNTNKLLLWKGLYGVSKTRIYCRFYQYKIQLKHMKFNKYGGEHMKDLLGQDINLEYIQYQSSNTFIITELTNQSSSIIQKQITDAQNYRIHYMKDILSHTTISAIDKINDSTNRTSQDYHNNKPKCTQYISGTTYFIQRYEYVNLFHTMTDWWNTWLAIDSIETTQYNNIERQKQSNNTNNTNINIVPHNYNKKQIVFLDSHPNGILDNVWNILFHNYSYIGKYITTNKSKKKSWFATNTNVNNDALCFDDAVLVPAGYASEFSFGWYDDSICKDYITTERFVNYVLDHFNIYEHPINHYHFIYIDRRPYISHPRATIEKFNRIITNLDHVATVVQKYVDKTFNISSTYEIIQLDQYSMMEQIQRIRMASILFGYHGAGLTHLLFLHYNSGIIEIQHASGGDLFINMAKWKKNVNINNITLTNGTIIQDEDILHYQLIPSLYSRHMTNQYIDSYLLPAFHSIIIKQQQKRNLSSSSS